MVYKLQKKYDSLGRIDKWDTETQSVIKKRIAGETGDVLTFEFLTDREGEILEILVDVLIPQEKNKEYVKIPQIIDHDLALDAKGVRYGENPWPRDFYRKGLADFFAQAGEIFEKPLEDSSVPQLENLISKIFTRNPSDFLHRFLKKVLSDATAIFFSHPASWNMIGFPGPAFPEGYPFLACGEKEDWEPNYEKKSSKN